MRNINYLILLLFSTIIGMGTFCACDDNDEVLVPIDIQEVCGIYTDNQVKITFNDGYLPVYQWASLTMETSDGSHASSKSEAGDSGKMYLEICPLWPNLPTESLYKPFENVIVEVNATASAEWVTFEGGIKKPEYQLMVKGTWKDGKIEVDLTYTAFSRFIGKRYLFDLNTQSLNMGMLTPSIQTVEWKGEQIPVEEFVRDAFAPVLEVVKKRLGGSLYLEMLSDGSARIGVKSDETGQFEPLPGVYGYRNLNGGFGYLVADYEGALWFSKTLLGDFTVSTGVLGSIDNLYFFPVFFLDSKVENEIRMAFDTPINFFTHRFLFLWMENVGQKELSAEELEKVHKLTLLFQDGSIDFVLQVGTVIE